MGLFFCSFIIGVLCANMIFLDEIRGSGIFQPYYLEQMSLDSLQGKEFLLLLIELRVIPVVILWILGATKFGKISSVGMILWLGYSYGVLFSMGMLQWNLKGILLCVLGLFPQVVFYIIAYGLVILYATGEESINPKKRILIISFALVIGILLEGYLNPIVVQWYIHMM